MTRQAAASGAVPADDAPAATDPGSEIAPAADAALDDAASGDGAAGEGGEDAAADEDPESSGGWHDEDLAMFLQAPSKIFMQAPEGFRNVPLRPESFLQVPLRPETVDPFFVQPAVQIAADQYAVQSAALLPGSPKQKQEYMNTGVDSLASVCIKLDVLVPPTRPTCVVSLFSALLPLDATCMAEIPLGITHADVSLILQRNMCLDEDIEESSVLVHDCNTLSLEVGELVDVHDNTVAALSLVCSPLPIRSTLQHVYVYVDGTGQAGIVGGEGVEGRAKSAWAFAVLEEHAMGYMNLDQSLRYETCYKFKGFAAGHVVTDPLHPHWIGATNHLAGQAEASAQVWAIQWCLGMQYPKHVVLHLCFDCMHVGKCASGAGGWSDVSDMPRLLRACGQLLQQVCSVIWEHVFSHRGQPWNELVDVVANNVCLQGREWGVRSPLIASVYQCKGVASMEWLWFVFAARHKVPDLPQVMRNGNLQVTYHHSNCNFDNNPMWRIERKAKHKAVVAAKNRKSQRAEICLKFGSANVFTLGPAVALDTCNKTTSYATARSSHLQGLMEQQQYDLVGIQESRTRADGTWTSGAFLVIASASNKGHGGCELWINVNKAYAKEGSKDVSWKATDFVVIHDDPQRLLVGVTTQLLQFDILVAHAPYAIGNVNEASRVSWWRDTRRIILSRKKCRPLDVLIGANATVGTETSALIGSCDAESPNGGTASFTILARVCAMPPCDFRRVSKWTQLDVHAL
ncbi:unnamed protein product [Polarella glacialis]|uniref:RNase H type-1 domain-containing protein n=1 Tax=Polarella glacialis TaxID=89957 RepID=A0A813FZK2_POLGL|nr:unnamed protein product [Polarella glacialis]